MKKEETNAKTNIDNTHVPDKVYAFMIQSHHMLYELLNCKKGDCVSVEVFDDVGVEHEDGSKDAIQLKSALSNRNPVSNRSVDLWKTMYNWLIAVEEGALEPENVKFILFINVNKDGTIVNDFHSSNTLEEAEIAWDNARKNFYDEEGRHKELAEGYEKYVESFFAQEKKELACKVIKNFELKKCITNHSTTVQEEFNKTLIPPDIIEPIYGGIIGWIDTNVTKMVEAGEPIIISHEQFQVQLNALYREHNQRHSLMAYSVKPSDQEVQREFQNQRIYIEQLAIIDCNYTEKVEAVNDYLRASIDRTKWAENGCVSIQNLQTYEEKLKRAWDLQRRMAMLEKKNDSPKDQGKWLYYKCQDKKVDMDTVSVPEFFQNGCYHALSDDLEIGWHPDYLKEIKGEK